MVITPHSRNKVRFDGAIPITGDTATYAAGGYPTVFTGDKKIGVYVGDLYTASSSASP